MTVLKAEDIFLSYGTGQVLRGLGIEVSSGEMLGLIGPNGAGKTTLLRVLTGALEPQRGSVSIDGHHLRDLRPRDIAQFVALVPQNPVVPEGFSALEVVLMGRNPHLSLLQWEGPKDLAVALSAMELTSTRELANRSITTLSGGEKQRVFIARALAQEPSLLLLDEPTAHVDIGYQARILDTLGAIRRETGIAVLAAMHDLTLAAQYCHRIAVLHQGKIFALGRPEQVLTSELVSAVFGAEVCLIQHPIHGTPAALPVSQALRADGKQAPAIPKL